MADEAGDSALNSGVAYHKLKILVLLGEFVHIDKVLELTIGLDQIKFFHEAGISETVKVRGTVDSSNSGSQKG